MSLWLALAAMTVIAAALVGLPLLRASSGTKGRRGFDLAVYRAQLEEVERERARGLLGPDEAAAARLEVERRMLVADAEHKGSKGPEAGRRPAAALALLACFLVASGVVYWQTGRPDLPGQPFAGRGQPGSRTAAQPPGAEIPSVDTMIARLEERITADPNDLQGWLRLARAYAMTQRFEPAAQTYRRAIAVLDDVATLHSGLGEALVMASGGTVTQAARDAFAEARARDPGDARARFYEGLWRVQRGERELALEVWTALVADTPPDAPWHDELRDRVAGLARELGRDPAAILPPPAAAPTVADLAERAAQLSARLEAEPEDYQGWIELAQTWNALGDPDRARNALQMGSAAYEGAPFVQQQLSAAATELGVSLDGDGGVRRGPTAEQMRDAAQMSQEEQAEMIRGMVSGLAARLEDDPDDLEGWRMLGRSYMVLEQPQESAKAYRHVAEALPDDLDAQLDYADALLAAIPPEQPLPPALVQQMEHVLTLDPDSPGALFHLGRAAAEAGDIAQARTHWQRLVVQIPADAPQRAQIQQMLDLLPAE